MLGVPNRAVRLFLLPAAIFALSAPALAQNKVFVLIPTIAGSSTDPAHTGWIDAYALDHAATKPSGGQAIFSGLTILKGADAATAALHDALATGAALAPSTSSPLRISVCRTGTFGQECFYEVSLASVLVTGHAVAGSSCLDPSSCAPGQTESVTFEFTTITWRYIDWPGGKKGKTFEKCWNILKGATCTPF